MDRVEAPLNTQLAYLFRAHEQDIIKEFFFLKAEFLGKW